MDIAVAAVGVIIIFMAGACSLDMWCANDKGSAVIFGVSFGGLGIIFLLLGLGVIV